MGMDADAKKTSARGSVNGSAAVTLAANKFSVYKSMHIAHDGNITNRRAKKKMLRIHVSPRSFNI